MKEPVIIKSNKYGIQLILDNELPLEQLLLQVKEKFKQCEKFFQDAVVAISFSGRELSQEEQCQIIQTITDTIDITVSCIMDSDEVLEVKCRKALEKVGAIQTGQTAGEYDLIDSYANSGEFYRGTLRSGQSLETERSIVVIGDVNPGARVVSGGNIIVLGALKGIAYAGIYGNDKTFVVALEMDPMQIRIGNYLARSEDSHPKNFRKKQKKAVAPEPQAAVVLNGNICIETITRGFLNNLEF
ncbi:MAG: septum site-determining protein MinC [Eubacterium sp.]|nr:septum site-determining protein MinC [Eubacterium sp.]